MSQRCIWSKKEEAGTHPVTLQTWNRPRGGETFYVCPAHEDQLRHFLDYQRRFFNVLLVLFGIVVIAIVMSALLESALGVGLSVFAFGVGLLVFPFATPDTVRMVGVRGSIWVARGIGVALIGFGFYHMIEGL